MRICLVPARYRLRVGLRTIEDVGTARMSAGIANVQIDPDFASVMGFQVSETQRGRSSLEFDYRIVAHPLGATADRLPPAPALHKPKPITVR